jgi:glucose/mannose-6-phosphate isomerase
MSARMDLKALAQRVDPSDMLGLVSSFPSQMENAWDIGRNFAADLERGDYQQVTVCGMGGSAIGGDMLRSFFGDRLKAPLVSCRDYRAPAFIGSGSFVIISSYSGNTGETLSAYESIRERGASVVAVSSGGQLEKICRTDGVPFCRIPGGMSPRAAIAYSFFPMIQILRVVGLAQFEDAEFDEALETARRLAQSYGPDSEDNRAFELAKKLEGKYPYVYSGPGLLESIARRWACQFNENSKSPAHFAVYPELNHNEIVGWREGSLSDLLKRVVVISLEDVDDHEMTRNQTGIGLGIEEPLASRVVRLDGGDGGRLSRMMALLITGDFTSVYLAFLYGVDPTPVENIDFLKQRLADISQDSTR